MGQPDGNINQSLADLAEAASSLSANQFLVGIAGHTGGQPARIMGMNGIHGHIPAWAGISSWLEGKKIPYKPNDFDFCGGWQ